MLIFNFFCNLTFFLAKKQSIFSVKVALKTGQTFSFQSSFGGVSSLDRLSISSQSLVQRVDFPPHCKSTQQSLSFLRV